MPIKINYFGHTLYLFKSFQAACKNIPITYIMGIYMPIIYAMAY
jgi:hypothetical protein